MRRLALLSLAVAMGFGSAAPASAQLSTLRITEAMSSSGVGGTVDWWEVTNFGTSAVDITGWKMDDSSFSAGLAVPITPYLATGTSFVTGTAAWSLINPGQSAVFLETAAPQTDIEGFKTFWGGSAATALFGSYTGSGVGLSSTGDGVVLFNTSNAEATPRVTFGAATTGSSFYYQYQQNGDPTTSPNSNAVVSTVGSLGGQITYLSVNTTPQNTASPGTAINAVPEPSSLALLGCGASVAVASVIRRRRA